jgi:FkbM family methyltransferase
MLIFDIGANLGNYTATLLGKYPDATFVVVDANPRLVQHLVSRFSAHTNIHVFCHALSNESGKIVKFNINNTTHSVSTVSIDWITKSRFAGMVWDEVIEMDTITLDDLIQRFGSPDIMKIDVEGYEKEVLSGLTHQHGVLSFEWAEEEKHNIQLTCQHLHSIGYQEFSFRETDGPYDTIPDTFYSYDEFCNVYFPQLIPERKERWGMVFAR